MGDISYRALKSIEQSQIVLCEDTRVAKKLFSLIETKLQTPLNTENKKFIALHSHNENNFFINCNIDFDLNIIYISDAGTPCVSDPGSLLVDFCIKNNIKYDFISGASAFLSAFVMSGFLHNSFLFYGFLPHKGKSRNDALDELLNKNEIAILYESPYRIQKLLEEIAEKDKERLLFVVKEISKLYQTSFRDTPVNIQEKLNNISTKGEWVVVISPSPNTKNTNQYISKEDINTLSIPPKQKAKLLSKVTGESITFCYDEIMNTNIS